MQSTMRARLESVIAYHTAVAEAALDDAEMYDLHTEVARQLQEVIDADPIVSAIDTAMANRIVRDSRPPSRRRVH
jgi:hypothetical protein